MKIIALIILVLVSVKSQASICENRKTDLSLILSMDVSDSIDNQEVLTQIEGYKNSLSNPMVINNLLNCQCTAIGVVLWASTAKVGFEIIRMESMAEIDQLRSYFEGLLAEKQNGYEQGLSYTTELVNGLEFSRNYLLTQKDQSHELMIMISGDGADSRMMATLEDIRNLRTENEQDGIVVNGLPLDIYREESDFTEAIPLNNNSAVSTPKFVSPYPNVSDYYEQEVITSTGYVDVSESFVELEKALTNSLLRNTCKLMM